MLNGPDNILSPHCYIRLDVSHFVKMISRWKCFKQDKSPDKKFYLRALCQVYKMRSLEELQVFFEAILTIALSEFIGYDENGDVLPSESQLRYLNKIIKGVPPPEICDTNEIHDECSEMQQTEEMSEQDIGNWTEWTNKIYHCAQENAKMSNEGITINTCFNPNAAAIIKTRLMPYVAIWSGIMQTFFNINTEVATSTYVEAEFAEIKNRVFKGQLPMKADKFVYEHLEYINGRIKLASCPKDIESAHVENIIHDISSASSIQTDADRSIECSIETIETSKEEDTVGQKTIHTVH